MGIKGRALDNVVIYPFSHILKYEEICLNDDSYREVIWRLINILKSTIIKKLCQSFDYKILAEDILGNKVNGKKPFQEFWLTI